ncbi:response regulator [Caballeronia sp. LZ035]|uniref:response regulator n=1 Tax=Caballeronia sp. LZ035 TaxID=3038568 RepID=UPI00285EA482|nr:response regulator [Caballeronia sp. LZ035]MDR5763237.1 response regulator [Caballeronia sp. LZ035]
MFSHRAARWSDRTIEEPQSGALRLLVVDDYEPGAEALAAVLHADGYQVRCVFSGRAALQLTQTWVPNIAVLDINMPEMNGLELAHRLRLRPVTSDIGIIAFTALDESAVRSGGVDTSFDGYCQKAGAPTTLLRLITRMLRSASRPPTMHD